MGMQTERAECWRGGRVLFEQMQLRFEREFRGCACLGEGVFTSTESQMSSFCSTHRVTFITAMVICTVASAQTLPSAVPGAPCTTPGIAATYGANGMLLCSASLTWKPAIRASTPTNDGGLVSVVGQRMNRAMASIVDGTAQFVHGMLAPSSN